MDEDGQFLSGMNVFGFNDRLIARYERYYFVTS